MTKTKTTEQVARMENAEPTTALAKAEERMDITSFIPTADVITYAEMISKTDFCPKGLKGKPEDVALAIMMGREIGLKPMQAVQGIAVINGVPSTHGATLMATIRAHPMCEYIHVKWDEESKTAYCICKRINSPVEETHSFSYEQAKKAGLTSRDLYKSYEQDMITWKAVGRASRFTFPDVTKGIAIREEAEHYRQFLDTDDSASALMDRMEKAKRLSSGTVENDDYVDYDDVTQDDPEPEPVKKEEEKKAKVSYSPEAFSALLEKAGLVHASHQSRLCQLVTANTDLEFPDFSAGDKERSFKALRFMYGQEKGDLSKFIAFAATNGLFLESPKSITDALESFHSQ